MKYVCIEDDKIISVIDYKPVVPASVSVVEISDEQYQGLQDGTKYFDLESMIVQSRSDWYVEKRENEQRNAIEKEFLNSTDWMILRHIRQKFLQIETSLSEQQYRDLEQKRHDAANRIVQINNDG